MKYHIVGLVGLVKYYYNDRKKQWEGLSDNGSLYQSKQSAYTVMSRLFDSTKLDLEIHPVKEKK